MNILTPAQVAQRLQCDVDEVMRYIESGRLQSVALESGHRVTEGALRAFLRPRRSPRKTGAVLAVLSTLCLAAGAFAFSQQNTSSGLPVVLPYQGTLTESTAQGGPVSGQRTMQFRLFDADAPGGNTLYASSSRSVEVVDGRFSVVLGSSDWPGTANNELDAADLRAPALWLELTMNDPQGGAPITFARQRVAPAPQAVTASQAAGAFTVPAQLTVSGNATVVGSLGTQGATTLGNGPGDPTTVSGDLTVGGKIVLTHGASRISAVGLYCGQTAATQARFVYSGVPVGHAAGKRLCEDACGNSPSAHMCTLHELTLSVQVQAIPPTAGPQLWIGGLHESACAGWTEDGSSMLGRRGPTLSIASAFAPGDALCSIPLPIACCD